MTFPKKPSVQPPPVPPAVPSSRPAATPPSVSPQSRAPVGVPLSMKPPTSIRDAKMEAHAIAGGALGRSAAPAPVVGKKTILIVDGDAAYRAALKRQLDAFYNIAEAKDGMEACEMAPSLPNLGLVVSDVVMPRVDGFTLAKILRSNAALKRVPIMFVSTRNSPQDVTQALVLGVVHYFQKTTPASQIADKIRKVVV